MEIQLIQKYQPKEPTDKDVKLLENKIFMIRRNEDISPGDKLKAINEVMEARKKASNRQPRLYPHCEKSKLLIKLLGKKCNGKERETLTSKHIEIIKQMGIKVTILKPQQNEPDTA